MTTAQQIAQYRRWIDVLERMIASNQLSSNVDGTQVTYGSFDEIRHRLGYFDRKIARLEGRHHRPVFNPLRFG